jgi:PAS domain S-box-containing protein
MGADFAERRLALRRLERSEHEHRLADGRWVRVRESRMADGGRVLLSTDVTAAREREQERAMLAAAIGQVADSVEVVGADFRLRYVNPAFTALTGWTEAEALGRTPAELLRSDEHDAAFYAGIEAALGAGETWRGRLVSRHKEGHLLYQEATISPVRDAAGRFTYSVAVKRDVSERTRAEAALAASEARYRAVVEAQTEFVVRYLPDGRITFVNDAYCRYLGRTREELLDPSWNDFDLLMPEDRERNAAHVAALTPERPTATIELQARNPGGDVCWSLWTDTGIFDAEGRLVEMQSVGRDTTERRRAEAALAASEELLRAIVDDQTELVARFDAGYRLVFCNAAYARVLLERTPGEVAGIDLFEAVPAWFRDSLRAELSALTPGRPVFRSAHETVLPAGETHWFEWVDRALFDAAGRPVGFQAVGRDVTEQRRAEAALKASEARFQAAADSLADGLAIFDADGRLAYHNRRFADHLMPGVRAVLALGRRLEDMVREGMAGAPVYHEDMGPDFLGRRLALRELPESDHEQHLADGRWMRVRESRMSDGGRVMLMSDITARKEAEAALKASEARLAR